jgi:hypothetical protein
MNKEEYLKYLMEKSKYCSCPSLSELSKIGKDSEKLERICDEFYVALDLENPKIEDLNKILDYSNACKKFEASVEDYKSQLSFLLNKGDLKLNLHYHNQVCHNKVWKKREIKNSSLAKFPKESIITLNCASCNSQIDILNSYAFIGAHSKEHTHKE